MKFNIIAQFMTQIDGEAPISQDTNPSGHRGKWRDYGKISYAVTTLMVLAASGSIAVALSRPQQTDNFFNSWFATATPEPQHRFVTNALTPAPLRSPTADTIIVSIAASPKPSPETPPTAPYGSSFAQARSTANAESTRVLLQTFATATPGAISTTTAPTPIP